MKKLKIIILLFSILLVTGCNAKYNLYINKKEFKEQITFSYNEKDITNNRDYAMLKALFSNDIYALDLYNDYSSGTSPENAIYTKKVKNTDGKITAKLSYLYKESDLRDSYVLTKCFSEHSFIDSGSYYYLNLSGKFLCGISKNNNIDINIITNNVVIKNNATKIDGNKYTWKINDKNIKKNNIMLKIAKEEQQNKTRMHLQIIIIIVMILMITVFILFKKGVLRRVIS